MHRTGDGRTENRHLSYIKYSLTSRLLFDIVNQLEFYNKNQQNPTGFEGGTKVTRGGGPPKKTFAATIIKQDGDQQTEIEANHISTRKNKAKYVN